MSDIKIVLYKENRAPRSIALSTQIIYRILFLAMFMGVLVILSLGMATRFYFLSREKTSQVAPAAASTSDDVGPSNSIDEQNRWLRDQVEQLKSRLQTAQATQSAPKEIDKKNPALALFGPTVVDRTQDQNQIVIKNFRFSHTTGKSPATLTFELYNAHPGESTEKGYIVVLARNDNGLDAYPHVFHKTGPYLLDFENGETFQVARFRLVNATFEADAKHFQVLIFTRKGEILINTLFEVKE